MGVLVLVVLLLVVSPVLLYLVGWTVKRTTLKAQARAVFPVHPQNSDDTPGG